MTYKQRLLKTINGEPTDYIPFVPRLDLWYRANKLNRTLPSKYKNATLKEILQDLDIGYHAVVPNFKDLRSEDDEIDRALGIYQLWFIPYEAILHNINRKVVHDGNITKVTYQTPKGNIRTATRYDDSMKQAGITITHIAEHAIKSVADFEAVGYIFENIEVQPNYDGFKKFKEQIGEMGLAVGFISLAASGMHLIMRELAEYTNFVFMFTDNPKKMADLAGKIQKYLDKVFNVVADSSAEVIFSGANYDSFITYPPFYKEHITPFLKAQANELHKKGKFLLTHTDGENTGLLEEYIACGFDIADSICPAPMTKLTLKQIRDCFNSKITIWGAVPSVSVLEDSMSDKEFYKYIDDMFEQIGGTDHLILSIADTAPPAMKFERLIHLAKLAKEFGPVR